MKITTNQFDREWNYSGVFHWDDRGSFTWKRDNERIIATFSGNGTPYVYICAPDPLDLSEHNRNSQIRKNFMLKRRNSANES